MAQSTSVTGLVSDSSKAALPNAPIILTDQQTGAILQGKSNGAGIFSLPFVQPGIYTLSADAAGFRHYEQRDITIGVGKRSTLLSSCR